MEQNLFHLPGYAPHEFLLVLEPHEELKNKIKDVKKEFSENYQHPKAYKTQSHIVIASFVQYAMMEQRLINRLKLIAMSLPPIKVDLKDFGSFPSHTIVINIVSKVPIVNMVKAVRQAQRLMKINNDNKPHFIMEPHLTVARKLQPGQYEKAWLEYEHKHFSGKFIVNHLLLLKRQIDDTKYNPYQVVDRFPLQNLPVLTKQGQLF